MCNRISSLDVHSKVWPSWHVHGDSACENHSSKSLYPSTSVSEGSESHGTEAMDNSRLHSDSTSKPEEDRYQRSTTVSDTPEAETGSNEAMHACMHNSSSRCDSDSKKKTEKCLATLRKW